MNGNIQTLSRGLFLTTGLFLLVRIVLWIKRIRTVQRIMPVVPVLVPPTSPFRMLWPKRWQTFYDDWNMQYKRSMYHKLGSDVFALISLFDFDKIFVCEPDAIAELKLTELTRFPKQIQLYSQTPNDFHNANSRNRRRLWTQCPHNDGRRMEASSENHVPNILTKEFSISAC